LRDEGDNSNNSDEEPKAIKMAKELQKEKLNIDPEQVLEEQENRNLQMNKWMESMLSKKGNLMIIVVYPISVLTLFCVRLSVF